MMLLLLLEVKKTFKFCFHYHKMSVRIYNVKYFLQTYLIQINYQKQIFIIYSFYISYKYLNLWMMIEDISAR